MNTIYLDHNYRPGFLVLTEFAGKLARFRDSAYRMKVFTVINRFFYSLNFFIIFIPDLTVE